MFSHLLEDYKSHREGMLSQGFWALSIHRFAARRLKVRFKPLRVLWGGLNLLLLKFSEVFFGISIPEKAIIGRRFNIEHFGSIILHGDTVIGDDCLIRHGVTIGLKDRSDPRGVPTLGNRVEIGAGAKVLGRIKIGDDVIIGANAVVLVDVPSGCLAVGIPARIIRRKVLK